MYLLDFFIELDHQITFFLNSFFPHSQPVSWFFYFWSFAADFVLFWVVIGIYFLFARKHLGWRFIVFYSFVLFFDSLLVNIVLKPVFSRPRPFMTFESINTFGPLPSSFSFPSAHASLSASAGTILNFFDRRRVILWWFIAFFIVFSRIYLGVHYLSDVFMGVFTGWSVARAFLFLNILRKQFMK